MFYTKPILYTKLDVFTDPSFYSQLVYIILFLGTAKAKAKDQNNLFGYR